MTRKAPNMSEKLAAAYLSLVEFRDGKWQPVIDRIECKKLTAAQICGLFEVDHYPISVFMGGDNHPTNLTPMLKAAHREKTNKQDAKTHAKLRRSEKKKAKEDAAQRVALSVLNAEDIDMAEYTLENNTLLKRIAAKTSQWHKPTEKQTEANKAYRKAIYAKRKAARKANMPAAKWKRKRGTDGNS